MRRDQKVTAFDLYIKLFASSLETGNMAAVRNILISHRPILFSLEDSDSTLSFH